jgi:hypothetical protein
LTKTVDLALYLKDRADGFGWPGVFFAQRRLGYLLSRLK